jgi:hypothetical protein
MNKLHDLSYFSIFFLIVLESKLALFWWFNIKLMSGLLLVVNINDGKGIFSDST